MNEKMLNPQFPNNAEYEKAKHMASPEEWRESVAREWAKFREITKDLYEWTGSSDGKLVDIGPMMIRMNDDILTVKDKKVAKNTVFMLHHQVSVHRQVQIN